MRYTSRQHRHLITERDVQVQVQVQVQVHVQVQVQVSSDRRPAPGGR